MSTHDDLSDLGDALRAATTSDLARTERAGRVAPARRRGMRSRVLAGGTLGLAGLGAGLVLAFSGSTAPPAFAMTTANDGSVLVTFNYTSHATLLSADQTLGREYGEDITVDLASGPATVPGAVDCTPSTTLDPGAGTPVRVLLGHDGTSQIPSGSTGAGTVHVASCTLYDGATGAGNSGS